MHLEQMSIVVTGNMLFASIEHRFREGAAILLDHGVEVNCKGFQGITPLLFAVKIDNLCAATELLERGANIDAEDNAGTSALI